jgi:hypothetical protein
MAQGIHTRADILTKLSDGTDLNALWSTYQQVIGEWNSTRQGIVSFLTFGVTNPVETIPVVGQDANFEKASEFGVPKSARPALNYWQLGFKFDWFDLAARFTWQFLSDATATQVDSIQNMAMEADSRMVTTEVLRTLFDNANRSADINHAAYNVYSFYNNDGTIPPPYKGNTFLSTHTHYRGSNAATIDPQDLEQQIQDLEEHGYTVQNGYTIITLVNRAEMNVIRTFKAGTPDATHGTYDFIPSAAANQVLVLPQNAVTLPAGSIPPSSFNGMTVMGSYGPTLIIQEDFIPLHYVVSFATGGPDNLQNPIGFRQHANADLQGMRLVKGPNPDYPIIDSYYIRGFGTGVRNRGAASVTQIVASTTYTPPTTFLI